MRAIGSRTYGQRIEGVDLFASHVKRRSARDQDPDGWRGQDQFADEDRCFDDLLEVVENQQQLTT
jgi:hypothetical protein